MRLLDELARLDARVVPRLARGLHRVGALVSRWRPRPLPVVAALLVLAVLVTALWRLGDPPAAGLGTSSTVRVGVSTGDSVPEYIATNQAELARLVSAGHPPVYALVSLSRYLAPDQVAATVGGLRVDPVLAYARLPVPARQTQLLRLPAARLPDDLVAAMAQIARRKTGEARDYDRLARGERRPEMRLLYESNADLARAEAAAYQGGCGCVFALVVRAAPGVLRELAARADVRVVDAAPEAVDIARTVFVAPLPDQVGHVEPPPDDVLMPPTGRPS